MSSRLLFPSRVRCSAMDGGFSASFILRKARMSTPARISTLLSRAFPILTPLGLIFELHELFFCRAWRHTFRRLATRQVRTLDWLGGRDSNPDTQIQSLQSYR